VAVFPLIREPDRYKPGPIDLEADAEARAHWLEHFRDHLDTLMPLLYQQAATPDQRERADRFAREYCDGVDRLAAHPEDLAGRCNIVFDYLRDGLLREHGFPDPYKAIKDAENNRAVALYPALVGELAGHADLRELIEVLVRNVFAGNIFDMGSLAFVAAYQSSGQDFFATRRNLRRRPWLIDHLDRLTDFLIDGRFSDVMMFVDNAGADVVLGAVPFAKHLARCAERVTLVANSLATLNDITIDELNIVLNRLRAVDDELDAMLWAGRLTTLASGTGEPLLDLTTVSEQCADRARACDFLILEGMGRSVESNREVEFLCPTLKIALLKSEFIARRLGGQIYDPVCRFELPSA